MTHDLRPKVARLDEVEPIDVAGVNWLPLRRALGATGFGVAAFTADAAGERLIEPHDETSGGAGGHEELYFVLSGRATFTLGEGELDAPAGTLVLVPVGLHRTAVAEEPGTTVLAVGGVPGAAMPPSPFEYWFLAEPAYRAGEYERAIEIASEGLPLYPDHASLRYQLACYCSLAGRGDEAVEHLRVAFAAGDPRVRAWAADDSDLDPIRNRPDYPN
jgi:tetratricopeptide (TPR) repeat protein